MTMPLESSPNEQQQQQQIATQSTSLTTNEKSVSWERLMESLVRITFAGSGGSLVGLALQKQTAKAIQVPSVHRQANKHLPMTWAVSCMLFALLIETSRIVSPTTSLLTAASTKEHSWIQNEYQTIALTTVGDYMAGGTLAGLAGSIGINRNRRGPVRPPPVMMSWGLGVGALLGALFGMIQAGIDIGNYYLLEQQNSQREEEPCPENDVDVQSDEPSRGR